MIWNQSFMKCSKLITASLGCLHFLFKYSILKFLEFLLCLLELDYGQSAVLNFCQVQFSKTCKFFCQNQFGSPDELANMFQELGINGAGPLAGANAAMTDLPPFMQSIMQSFLSKEILYPAVKEFVDRVSWYTFIYTMYNVHNF